MPSPVAAQMRQKLAKAASQSSRSSGRSTRFADAGGHAPVRPAPTRIGESAGKVAELQSGIQLTLEGARLDVPEWLRAHLARL